MRMTRTGRRSGLTAVVVAGAWLLGCSSSSEAGPGALGDGTGASSGAGGGGSAAGAAGTGDTGAGTGGGTGCAAGLSPCGIECVDLATSSANCGTCGQACGVDETCCGRTCQSVIGGDAPPLVAVDACGRLSYGKYANEGETNRDNRLPDFSFAGYERGGVPIPEVATARTVQPGAGDDRERIQDAIDEVSALPLGDDGFRGAVLLEKGEYQAAEPIRIEADGVVLRGEGQGQGGTSIRATGKLQYSLIELKGSGGGLGEVSGSRVRIATGYVGVGSRSFEVESTGPFAVGDDVAVLRTPNQAWINELNMEPYGWTTDGYTIAHERRIVAIQGDRVTLDIPLVDTMQDRYGGGALFKTHVTGRLTHCGVEDVRLVSDYSGEEDESHGWNGIKLTRTTNSWVRRVTVQYFGYAAVQIEGSSNFNTVQDTAMIDLKSQITGGRRYPFQVSGGLGNLFQRCYARDGRHNFVTGAKVTGPNVWLDCLAERTHADDGPHHRWATGLLFDNTSSGELRVQNRQASGTGHGWAGAQVLFWNAEAGSVVCDAPKGAMNYAVGVVGEKKEGAWAPEEPEGLWESQGAPAKPRSLYLQQLQDRLGVAAVEAVTVPAQRSGRIWQVLHAWAGEGRLEEQL